jgi:REP element-mobilizing transposase RayT
MEPAMSFTRLNYHIVFSTKEREPWFDAESMGELASYFGGVIRETGGTLLEANGPADHVHLATILRPTVTVAEMVNKMKSNSSKWFKKRFRREAFAWQEGYAAFTVSYSGTGQVISYIRRQVEHHRKRSFVEELKALLKRHRIPFEEKYLL